MRIHFVANIHRRDALDAAAAAAKWLTTQDIGVAVEEETGRYVEIPVVANDEFPNADLVVAFGGDGTLIRASHLCSVVGTPILGVYYGTFGFVTQCTPVQFKSAIQEFLAGACKVESRMMVEAALMRNDKAIASIHALNEAVLQRSIEARMMNFSVEIDGVTLTQYPADGVMVSTPTGSTAYNLSAGGPILDPTVEALILTAVAPHTLSSRPLIIRPDSEVHIQVKSVGGLSVLSADGQTRLHLLGGDAVRIRRSPRITRLLKFAESDFLTRLNQRLFWSQGLMPG